MGMWLSGRAPAYMYKALGSTLSTLPSPPKILAIKPHGKFMVVHTSNSSTQELEAGMAQV
jgi:hypothetical protein